jgi:hypothetical protein
MQHHEVVEIHKHQHQTVAEFIKHNRLLKRLAGNEGLKPLDYLASCFVPECRAGEGYREWLVRQLGDILRAGLRADGVVGLDGTGTGKHALGYIQSVEFEAADAAYIERVFGPIRDVLLVWQEAQARLRLAA